MSPHPTSSKPVLAIDFDDTVVTYIEAVIATYNAECGGSIRIEDTYLPGELGSADHGWKHDRDGAIAWINAYMARPESIRKAPIPGVVESFKRLGERYELCIVTGRTGTLDVAVREWLAIHLPDTFERLYYTDYEPKHQLCQDIGAQYLIDDNPGYLNDCVAVGIGGILFGDYPWHAHHQIDPRVKRAKTWSEVEEILL